VDQSTIQVRLTFAFNSCFLEFIAATLDAQVFMREENLRAAFQMFDTDGSGKIDAKEIQALLEGDEFKD
jgi:Ca2+-binding EF-hand superfamily protein